MYRALPSLALSMACLLVLTACASSRTAGQKDADKVVKKVDETSKSVEDAQAIVQSTLTNYNAVLAGDAQLESSYKKLAKDADRLEDLSKRLQKALDNMKTTSDRFFKEWERSLEDITDPVLRQQASNSIATRRHQMDEIIEALEEGNTALEPFVASLNDQIAYLGFNLTPEAVASLQESAGALQQEADAFNAAMESAIEAANAYKAAVATK